MSLRVTMLCGGVGGAKLARGMSLLGSEVELTVIVNTGDDFDHLGLTICPDLDSVTYALAGLASVERGWGREDESWTFMRVLSSLGGEDWFRLGDGDLALHHFRTALLREGRALSEATAAIAAAWKLTATLLPMSDNPVRTLIETDEGTLPFQRYFVERQCAPHALAIRFDGAGSARPAPGAIAAIEGADLIVIAPSNPYLSVDPILAVPGIADALAHAATPVVAVSPLIGGKAVKGPAAKIMAELGHEVSNRTIALHYGGRLDGLLIHHGDEAPHGLAVRAADTLMSSDEDRVRIARETLALGREIAG